MIRIYLSAGTLEIFEEDSPLARDKPVGAGVLSTHLNRDVPSVTSEFDYIDLKDYFACQTFIDSTVQSIERIKFHNWKESYPAIFLGSILKKHPDIVELDFSDCHLVDADIPHILILIRNCSHLRVLNFEKNYISSDGALLILSTVLERGDIKVLNLGNNDIGYQTCQFIKEQTKTFTPTTVFLEDNHDPDEILRGQEQLTLQEKRKSEEYLGELAHEFQPGDLLYGLSAGLPEDRGRNPVHTALAKVLPPQKQHQLLVINPFSDWVINKNNFDHAHKRDLINFDAFVEELTPSLYPENEPFIRGWSEHKTLCKLGVLWAKRNDKKIHYILDDLNMDNFSQGNRNRADTSVTEAEIKFIARFYKDLRDNVQFWRTDTETGKLVKAPAPWLDAAHQHKWEKYLKAEQHKMKFFPKEELPKAAFFQTMRTRKQFSMMAYSAALENIFRYVIDQSSDPRVHQLMSQYLSVLYDVKTKHDIEKLILSLAKDYHTQNIQDKVITNFLSRVIKPANLSQSNTPREQLFLYRRYIQEMVYGKQVIDIQKLFKIADKFSTNEAAATDKGPETKSGYSH